MSIKLAECDIFPTGSYNWKLCRGETKLSREKVNLYRERWGLSPLFSDITPVLPINQEQVGITINPYSVDIHDHEVKYGPGSELLHYYSASDMPDCEDCFALCRKMNEWGVAGCEARLKEIVEDIFPRAKQWFADNKKWLHTVIPGFAEDFGIRTGITSDVKAAIERAKFVLNTKQQPPASVMQVASKKLRTINKGCSSCGGSRKQSSKTYSRISRSPFYSSRKNVAKVNVYTPSIDLPMVRIVTAIRTAFRKQPTLEQTIESMRLGGFESPIIYAEPNSPPRDGNIVAKSQLGPFKNFMRMCNDLLLKFPDQWLLLCEDDVLFREGTADFLREATLTKDQAVSFYIAKKQSDRLMEDGFSSIIGDIWGSLAYLIHATQLQKLINTDVVKSWNKPDRVDRMFSKAADISGTKVLFHQPALAQHIGVTSTINHSRTLTDGRTSDFEPSRHSTELVTLITCTGDRPEAFARCEQWIKNQRYTGNFEWIVVDDGKIPTLANSATKYVRETPQANHSLCRNTLAAIPHINGRYILFIEDDDYYGPDYISTMVGRLRHADLVGEFGAKYYYLPQRMWRHRLTENHASLCRTGITRDVLDTLKSCATGTDHPSIDLRLWELWTGSRLSWSDTSGGSQMCVGIKGSSGRQSHGWRPAADAVHDTDLNQLRLWCGLDSDILIATL